MFSRLRLRQFTLLVLAWFVTVLGVAMAAPAVNPQQVEWVCSASGDGQWIVHGGGSARANQVHAAECALCVTVAHPPPPRGPPAFS